MTTPPNGQDRHNSQVPVVLTAVFLAYLGQMMLNPIIAPLAREVGLAEWQVGVTISSAAVMVVLTSQFWGRKSQSWGRKPVLVAALSLAALAMALFASMAAAGMRGALTGAVLFVLFLVLRGIGFGTAIAAIPPTAQAYIADVTEDQETRVKGMAGVGAVQGVAMIAGSVLGGALAGFGLLTPLIVVPILLALGVVLVMVRLRKEERHELVETPSSVKPSDARVWPFLVAGFGMLTALGFVQVIAGFIVQDRLELSSKATGLVTGGVLLAAGVGMVLAQTVIVPKSGWTAPILMRNGAAIAVIGYILLLLDKGFCVLLISIFLIGLGLGTAMPGYAAGPTLLVNREEQGGLAGLVGATNGLTFVVAPTASTALYGVWPLLPVIIGGTLMALVTFFVVIHPRFKNLPTLRELETTKD